MTNLFSYMANVGSYSIIKEQRTENREQRTENREQRTENREQRTENSRERLKLLTLVLFSLTFFAGECSSPEPTKYTITFNSNGGSAVASITVTSGNKATKPNDPTRDLYTFAGWYKETELKTAFDFNTPITENITLYAKWTQNKPGVPTITSVTVVNLSQINIAWNDVSGATNYNLFDGTTQIGGDITDTKYSHTGLEGGSTHSYTLKACNDAGCSEASNAVLAKTNEAIITATELTKGTGKRDRYGVFTISANTTVENYRLAVKKASDPVPTATEMENGHHIKRNLSTTQIHVLIAHYLNAPILTWYEDGLVAADLPTDMTKSVSLGVNVIKDYSALRPNKWIDSSLLSTSTKQILYGKAENSSKVEALLTFTTDATTNDNSVDWDYVDPELGKTTITINSNDDYIFVPMQYRQNEVKNNPVTTRYFASDSNDLIGILMSSITVDIIGTPGIVYENFSYFITGNAAPSTPAEGSILLATNVYLVVPTNKAVNSEILLEMSVSFIFGASPKQLAYKYVVQ